jgi:hypothetical protein
MIAPPVGVKPTTPCVESTRTPSRKRPGRVVRMPDGTFKQQYEYRVVYAAVHGWASIEGRHVEHACDNPRCVRYGHLRLGGPDTNSLDAKLKGRLQAGEEHHQALLADDDVLAVRSRYSAGERSIDLAAEFGVSRGTIVAAVSGQTWPHLPGAVPMRQSRSRITAETVAEWVAARQSGESLRSIALRYGVDGHAVAREVRKAQ